MTIQVYPATTIVNNESTVAADWEVQVARGLVPGATQLNIFGYQASIGTTFLPVWENATTYTYPVSAGAMYIWSSTASDTSVQVLITGLDGSYNPASEIVTVTGTAVVPTVNAYLRVNRLDVVGTINAVGNISLGNSGKTIIYAQINAGFGHSQMMIYTVPNGYTFYLGRVAVQSQLGGGSSNYATYRVFTQNSVGLTSYVLQTPFVDYFGVTRDSPYPYPQKTDIQAQVAANSSTINIGIQWEGVLISNSAI